MGKKTLSISDARDEDSAYFRSLGSKTKPLNAVFTEVLNAHRNKNNVPAANEDANQALIDENQALKQQITHFETEIEGYQTELNNLKNQITSLETQLQNQSQQTQIEFPSFIYTPQGDQLAQIKRYFALLRKKGQINTDTPNLPQSLTNKAINYLFKNEYPEVIK